MIDAIRTALEPLNVQVYDSDATEAVEPYYVLVLAPDVSRSSEDTIVGGGAVNLIVRAVGAFPAHARHVLAETRALLRNLAAVSNGHRWSFHWDGSPRPVQVERVVREGATDTNYCWLDDEYTVYAEKV